MTTIGGFWCGPLIQGYVISYVYAGACDLIYIDILVLIAIRGSIPSMMYYEHVRTMDYLPNYY